MADFTIKIDPDQIATIIWDCPQKPFNILNFEAIKLLDTLIDKILIDENIIGAIITSAKPDFAAGMDLKVLADLKKLNGDNPAEGLFTGFMQMHSIMRKIERAGMDPKTNRGGKPIVTVLPGTALGIGLEIPLCTHRIFAANNDKAKIGLPEIKVGIFPGAGGTTRLVRKLGIFGASEFLLEGKTVDPMRAKSAGLIDEVSATPMADAKAWIIAASDSDILKPWDQKGYKLPGGAPYTPSGFMTFVGASAMVNGKTMGAYPATKALMSAVYEGSLVPFDTALRIEARWFTNIVMNPSSSAMIRSLFISKGALEKGAVRPKNVPDQSVRIIGILGAGMMGAGIALVAAQAGIEVVLVDQDQNAANKGKEYSEKYLTDGIKRGKISEKIKEKTLNRILATDDYTKLADADLVIEAVFEDTKVKSDVTKAAVEVIHKDCIFASNTSTLPISELAKASKHPENYIGIHFFSPVEKMLLVEIIKGEKTESRAVAKALDFVRQIKKTPIVVNDARFFYANRCIIPYLNEGLRMITEGIPPSIIESAAKQLGFPLGPIQLVDETSIELGAKIARATKAAMGAFYPNEQIDEILFWMEKEGRLGRKARAGFFNYSEKGKREGFWKGLEEKYPLSTTIPAFEDVQHRLMFIQALEAVRALEEGVLMDIREGDVGAILGWGFAPWSGGPLSWLDILGTPYAAERCKALCETYGQRFECPPLLADMGKNNEAFYERFSP
ncbi:3-hydroxyacyl-CoA dehydrogenase NAD-binding domain-containing protein [Paracoccaceae bacterium]|nr:3-hydroxyacyl-CoA dehydrogenase NAD-binding domain-containing protein [Paracoccaceae bacterium]MDC3204970.1 3-hydroxyacyl-CoA dehydrogenase NAD-binding domain-containing protein [Paracoccaceae bacterium]